MADLGKGIGGAASGAVAGSMILPGIGTAIGGVLGGLGGLFSGGNNDEEITALQQQAMDAIKNVDIPKLQQLQVALQPYKQAGLLTPEMEQTIFAPASEMANVTTDPRLKNAQMSALQKMTDMGQGGLTMQDMQSLDQIKRNSDTQERGKEQQILQDLQQRGQAGSGSELAARLSSAQNSANNAGAQGLQIGSTATQRALEAIMNSGTLGGNMRTEDFGEQSAKARAQDVINQFNTQNRQAVVNTNTAANNAAQSSNLQNKQNIMNANTGLTNEQAQNNAKAVQQDYENRLRKAQGIYSANSNQANNLLASNQRSNDAFAGTLNGIGSAVGAYAGYNQNQKLLDMLGKRNQSPTKPDAPAFGGNETDPNAVGFIGPTQN